MYRQQTLRLLQEYHPQDSDELFIKEQMIAFIEAQPSCFERSLAQGHITASAWLVSEDFSKALLLHHAKLDKWMQAGGHCDGNPNVLEVAIKEALEESGLPLIEPVSEKIFDIDIHFIPERVKEAAHHHYDIRFLLRAIGSDLCQKNHESKALLWIKKNSQLPTNSRSVVRMYEKWLSIK